MILSLAFAAGLSTSCATWFGAPPPCPAPSPGAVEDFHNMVRENIQDPSLYGSALHFIGEIERYCAGILAIRG